MGDLRKKLGYPELPEDVSMLEVELFLTGELSGEKLTQFQSKYDSDPELKAWVEFQKTFTPPLSFEKLQIKNKI